MSSKAIAASILTTASLVGIAGVLSIQDAVPSVHSPFALLTTFPAFLVFELDEQVWPSAVLFALAALPIVAGFLIASLPLFRRATEIPKRSAVTFYVFTILSVAWFWFGWSYGIQYQGLAHVLYVAAWNAIFIAAALLLLLINRKMPRFGSNLAFHGSLFVWLAWCALPNLGEMP